MNTIRFLRVTELDKAACPFQGKTVLTTGRVDMLLPFPFGSVDRELSIGRGVRVHDQGGLGRCRGRDTCAGQVEAAVVAACGVLCGVGTCHFFPELLQFRWNHA